MLNGLKLWNFNSGALPCEELCQTSFVLKTCQRTLILAFDRDPSPLLSATSHEVQQGQEAYLFLLETICGLKSKLIGENEIVGQFKDAYKIYAASPKKDTRLLLILEKLFKDAKDIRTDYLIGISQKTYASLTRRHLIQRARAQEIVVLGSGQLAEDLINQFKKKAKVILCARNSARVKELAELHQLSVIPWDNRHLLVNSPYIANTIGSHEILWGKDFFDAWSGLHSHRLFVDLGSPSVIETDLAMAAGIVRLEDIFHEGAIVEEQKQLQIDLARKAMHLVTHKRKSLFEAKLNRQSSLLTPQTASDVRYL